VTGGAVRLGRELALGLAARGAAVAITYHSSSDAAAQTVAMIEKLGVEAIAISCDQRDEKHVLNAIRITLDRFGGLDVLVNSAAGFHRIPFDALDSAAWDRDLETDLRGPFLFALHSADALRAGSGGKIVNLVDIAGLRPWKHYLTYSVAKAGLVALTQCLARELAPEVQVNAIAPGVVLWPEAFTADQKEAALRRVPLHVAGSPADVVATMLYLIEGTDYVTGVVVPVDGGRLLD